MTSEAKLLPCPLCGAEPEYSPPSELSDLPFIACPTVLITPEGFEEHCGLTSHSVTHWNRRATSSALPSHPEVMKLVAEAEARGMAQAAEWLNTRIFFAPIALSDAETKAWLDGSNITVATSVDGLRAAAIRAKDTP